MAGGMVKYLRAPLHLFSVAKRLLARPDPGRAAGEPAPVGTLRASGDAVLRFRGMSIEDQLDPQARASKRLHWPKY